MQTRQTLRKLGRSVMVTILPKMLEDMNLQAGQDVLLSSEKEAQSR